MLNVLQVSPSPTHPNLPRPRHPSVDNLQPCLLAMIPHGLYWCLVLMQLASDWVTNKGRMKYCRPVFRLLYKQTPELAVKTFRAHENFYVSRMSTMIYPPI